MYEENRKFSWTNFFIKGIIVIIFVLFTVWLLSLSTKGLSSSLNVLTDDIFSQNIEKMKEVGKSYFTTERLPQKVGEIETLSLAKMYDERLILELKDKNGDACSARNSYVSVEKLENEYRMKVYLECGSEEDYVIVIMGCYDYCDGAICEKEETTAKDIEYQYSKTTGGKWTDYGKWSEWSKISVTENNYRDVETKVEKENYEYDKEVVEVLYEDFEVTCPSGYELSSDKTKCFLTVSSTDVKEPLACAVKDGYTLSQNGFDCIYSGKVVSDLVNPICPSGYTLNKSNFTCTKVTTNTYWKSYNAGYASCASTYNGYSYAYTSNGRCYYVTSVKPVTSCDNVCTTEYVYTYTSYARGYASCASTYGGYSYSYKSGSTCYYKYTSSSTDTKSASCADGYTKSGTDCVIYEEDIIKENATCESGYVKSGSNCVKTTVNTKYDNVVKTCPSGYKETEDGKQCYLNNTVIVKVTGVKNVTYYRYRVREYVGGTTDYKWSLSKNDKELLNAGYKLTGKTR